MKSKLVYVFDSYWKGLLAYEELLESDKTMFTKEYNAIEFYEALKAAYNMGIEVAANEFERINYPPPGMEDNFMECSKQDLLNLQIE